MTIYRVFCADCMRGYEQGGYKPHKCGACGSNFIAVKAITVADTLTVDDDEGAEHLRRSTQYHAEDGFGIYDA